MINVNLLMGFKTVKSSFVNYAGVHVRWETISFYFIDFTLCAGAHQE